MEAKNKRALLETILQCHGKQVFFISVSILTKIVPKITVPTFLTEAQQIFMVMK